MSIIYLNNPIEDVVKAYDRVKTKDVVINIAFQLELLDEEGDEVYGATAIHDDGSVTIELNAQLAFMDILEILAHELAHVVAGVENKHNAVWKDVNEDIFKEYMKIVGEEE